jgi:integrase/recombinase XerD
MDIYDSDMLIPVRANRKFTPDQIRKIQSEYRDFIWEYINDLNSKQTAKTYLACLRMFFEWTTQNFEVPIMSVKGIEFQGISRKIVVAYKKYLQTTGGRNGNPAAPLTIVKKLAALQSFFDYLLEKGVVQENPVSKVRRPRGEVVKETEDLDDKHVKELFRLVRDSKSNAAPMHRAVIYTLFCTGIRSAAFRNLKRKDFKSKDGIFYFEYFDKGKKKHKTPVHNIAVEQIQNYLEWMKSIGREVKDDHYLFQPYRNNADPNNLIKALNASGLSYILNYYVKELQLKRRISPHSARATLIGSLLAAGKEIHKVAVDVNHASVTTTARYDKRKRELKETTFFDAGFYEEDDYE